MMAEVPNAEQLEYWNGPAGERWGSQQEKIDENLKDITDALFRFAALKEGERVLDLGCGCGTTSFLAEKIVGEKGRVIGIDISNPMLEIARARARNLGSHVTFIEADAAVHQFGAFRFDVVLSRFGAMFFEDPVMGFTNVRRALGEGGRLVFVCWRDIKENDWANVPYQAALPLLPPQEPADPCAPGPFAFADAGRTKTILSRSGYKDVHIEKLDAKMYLGSTVEAAAEEAMNIGPLARAARELPEETQRKIRAVVEKVYRPFESKDGIAPPAACWLVRANV
ncbi:MAG: class I SAM-dependent methyltransferase [Alphaproteobacteria bacterium]